LTGRIDTGYEADNEREKNVKQPLELDYDPGYEGDNEREVDDGEWGFDADFFKRFQELLRWQEEMFKDQKVGYPDLVDFDFENEKWSFDRPIEKATK